MSIELLQQWRALEREAHKAEARIEAHSTWAAERLEPGPTAEDLERVQALRARANALYDEAVRDMAKWSGTRFP